MNERRKFSPEGKMRMGRISRKERNMNKRKGGVMAGATP